MPNRQPSHEVCVRLAVEVGAMDEAEGEQGVAHLVEHIVFMGSRDFDEAGGVEAAMRSIGCTLGADVNATTSFDRTCFDLAVPLLTAGAKSRSEHWLDRMCLAMRALADMGARALFRHEDVDHERAVVIEEWRRARAMGRVNSGDGGQAGAGGAATAAGTDATVVTDEADNRLDAEDAESWSPALHGTSLRPPIGLLNVIEHCPAERIFAFYRRFYRPSRFHLIIVGDMPKGTRKEAEEALRRGDLACRMRRAATPHEASTLRTELQSIGTASTREGDSADGNEEDRAVAGAELMLQIARSIFAEVDEPPAAAEEGGNDVQRIPAPRPTVAPSPAEHTGIGGTRYALQMRANARCAVPQLAVTFRRTLPHRGAQTLADVKVVCAELVASCLFAGYLSSAIAGMLVRVGSMDAKAGAELWQINCSEPQSSDLTTHLEALACGFTWSRVADSGHAFAAGQRVVLSGLISIPELNGAHAEVVRSASGDGPVTVAVTSTAATVEVMPHNLTAVRWSDGDGPSDLNAPLVLDAPQAEWGAPPLRPGDAAHLSVAACLFHVLEHWRRVGPTPSEMHAATELIRDQVMPVVITQMLENQSSPTHVDNLTPTCMRREPVYGMVSEGQTAAAELALYQALTSDLSMDDIRRACATWAGPAEASDGAAGTGDGGEASGGANSSGVYLGIALECPPHTPGKSDAESERVWAAAATHALAAQWRAVSALSLEQLERAPVIAALRKRQDRAEHMRAAAGGGDGAELLRQICADDPEGANADNAAWHAVCLGSPAGDPLGPVPPPPPDVLVSSSGAAEKAAGTGASGAPSLTRQQSSAHVASRQSVLSNGLHVQCHHVEGAMVDETTMGDAFGLKFDLAAGGRGTLDILVALRARSTQPDSESVSDAEKAVLGPLADLLASGEGVGRIMFCAQVCPMVAACFGYGMMVPLRVAEMRAEGEDKAGGAAMAAALASSMAVVIGNMEFELTPLERKLRLKGCLPTQVPLALRCLRALFDEAQRTINGGGDRQTDDDGTNNDATALEGATAGAKAEADAEATIRRALLVQADALEAQSSMQAQAPQAFEEACARAAYGDNLAIPMCMTTAVRIEHMRWLARSPSALRATRLFFAWLVSTSLHEWRLTIRGDLTLAGTPERLEALIAKYLGSLQPATGNVGLAGALENGTAPPATSPPPEQKRLLASVVRGLECCAEIRAGRPVSARDDGLPHHFCVLGGATNTTVVDVSFPLPPSLQGGVAGMLESFAHTVILQIAQLALHMELRERLLGTYAVTVQTDRPGGEAAMPGSTRISFTCAVRGVGPTQLLRGVARVLVQLQSTGPSDEAVVTAVLGVVEQMRRQKSTALGAIARVAMAEASGGADDVENRMAMWFLNVFDAAKRRAALKAVFPLADRSCVVMLPEAVATRSAEEASRMPRSWAPRGWNDTGIGDYVADMMVEVGNDAGAHAEEATVGACCSRCSRPLLRGVQAADGEQRCVACLE